MRDDVLSVNEKEFILKVRCETRTTAARTLTARLVSAAGAA
jgi:hypothetical protein